MDFSTYNSAKQHLLAAFNLCASTDQIQAALVTRVHELEAQSASFDTTLDWICHYLHEGLVHDHWIGRD